MPMLLANHKIKGERATIIFELLSLFVLLMIFSWFIHERIPLRLISFFVLISIAWIITNHHQFVTEVWCQIKTDFFSKKVIVFNLIGLQLGFLIALYFRYTSQMGILPLSFHWFLVVGVAIAVMEEILFRGIIQPMTEKINYYIAPTVAAVMHSAYKAMIFIPLGSSNTNIFSLFSGSLIAFIGLGYLKQFSGSIVPVIAAHVVFDILVYAEYIHAPWWVW